MARLMEKIKEATNDILHHINVQPEIGIILGSGLGELADEMVDATVIDYVDIPHFPTSTVEGHAGKLVIGEFQGKRVVAMKGRFHYYEGYSMQEVTFPVRVMKGLGVKLLIVTNACGGINSAFKAGDLMIIKDHLNMTGDNPLIGENIDELGPRFPDMSNAYDAALQAFVEKTAEKLQIPVQNGVYAGIAGPSYMTPAELNMLRHFGADAVGMSTVPEVIVANHMGIKVIGIACITDMAIPEELEPLTHEQVVKTANRTKPMFIKLVKEVISSVEV